jgi:holo-[acyl-carrier protein] synthase
LIAGIGTDIIETGRIDAKLNHEIGLKDVLFTVDEISYCESMKFSSQHFAARFAAKEAFFKALGTGWRYGMKYSEVEIAKDELGNPFIKTSGRVKEELEMKDIYRIHLTLSHTREYATAFVVLERDH